MARRKAVFGIPESRMRSSEFWTGAAIGYYDAKGGRYGDCQMVAGGGCPIDEALWQEAIAHATALADKRFPGVSENAT